MAQILVIACFLSIYAHDVMGASVLPPDPGGTLAFMAGLVLLVAVAFWSGAWTARRMDRTGNVELALSADRLTAVVRFCIALWHCAGVMVLGWAGAVREVVGDRVFIDEFLIVFPAMAALSLTWAAIYPVDRRLHDAVLVGHLDRGEIVARPLSRRQFTWSKVRHNLVLALLPISLLMGWSELVDRGTRLAIHAAERATDSGADGPLARLGARPGVFAIAQPVAQLIGVAVIMSAVPAIMRRVWDTTPLRGGLIRERVLDACARWNVRVRELLVWRTHGTMVNGAVLGFLAPFRYILLTDKLLESMRWPHIEAVTAHEIAHVKLHHLPWLVASILAAMAVGGVVSQLVFASLLGLDVEQGIGAVGAVATTLGVVVLALGPVSRTFERQADAFAAKHLSKTIVAGSLEAVAAGVELPATPSPAIAPGHADVVTPEGAMTMVEALQKVADLNGIPVRHWSFRHGSIAERQQHLRALAGQPAAGLRIDRAANRIKRAIAITLGTVVVLILAAELLG